MSEPNQIPASSDLHSVGQDADAAWHRLVGCPWENSRVPYYGIITGSPVCQPRMHA